jgi:hypothetical protein
MKISDKDLEQAAKIVCSSLSEELPAISNEPFSPAFEEKMEQLLRTEHQNKRWKVFARNTAAIVVVLLTLGGSILLLNTEARALTLSWCRKIIGDRYSYTFTGDHTGERLPDVEITALPEGYVLYDDSNGDKTRLLRFRKPVEGKSTIIPLSLEYSWMQDDFATMILDDEYNSLTCMQVTVNGCPADLYLSVSKKTSIRHHYLLWMDEDSGIFFYLNTRLPAEETIAVAESIHIVK